MCLNSRQMYVDTEAALEKFKGLVYLKVKLHNSQFRYSYNVIKLQSSKVPRVPCENIHSANNIIKKPHV